MHAYTVKFNLLTCLYVCLVHTTVFMNITMYILTSSYTAVILGDQKVSVHLTIAIQSSGAQRLFDNPLLISTCQAIFVTDNGSEYIFRLMPAILVPFPDIILQIYCL